MEINQGKASTTKYYKVQKLPSGFFSVFASEKKKPEIMVYINYVPLRFVHGFNDERF